MHPRTRAVPARGMAVLMADSNYGALAQGLKLYTDAMRRFVKDRLIAAYPNSWWESGVVAMLSDPQRTNLKRDLADHPTRDKVDHLDATHLVNIITRNFDRVFREAFGDFKRTQALLGQVSLARNESAHPRSGDMLADQVAYDLYAMVQLLSTAKRPEAAEVEKIRKAVLLVDAPAAAATPASAAKAGELPYWWQVCEPRDAFQNPATIDESVFAAT